MGSALLNPAAHASAELAGIASPPETPEELRRQVAARLAAHRERRLRKDATSSDSANLAGSAPEAHKSRIAAAVAQRYANAQSYRAFLAAEAERAVQQAHAAAEVAARNARAVAEAQQRLLDDLAEQAASAALHAAATDTPANFEQPFEHALWPELEEPAAPPMKGAAPAPGHSATKPRATRPRTAEAEQTQPDLAAHISVPPLRVVLYDDQPAAALSPAPDLSYAKPRRHAREDDWNDAEALALDEEISFRQSPVFEEPAGPPMALPANLIEFPRQLVASRKARPRYAEGPLRDEETAAGAREQLRIFEVEPGQISTTPELAEPATSTEAQWTSIWLDSPAAQAARVQPATVADQLSSPHTAVSAAPRLHSAKLSRRLLAGTIDVAITALAGLASAAAFAGTTGLLAAEVPWRLETLRNVAADVVATVPLSSISLTGLAALLLLSITLQAIFFTFSDATPGMRIARIGLCTFTDNNPTRAAMRLRVPALVLSTALFGFGFWWALLDQDHLTWHDLISRMYQRSY